MTEEASNAAEAASPSFNPSAPDSLIAFLAKAPGPVDLDTLAAGVGADDTQRDALQSSLTALAEKGDVVETRDGRYGSPSKMNLVVGRLACHEKGFGFVVPRDPSQEDLYIPHRKLGDAMHGDLVVARREATQRHKTEGRVIRLLQRARTQVVGRFERGKRFGYVVPVDPRIGYEVVVARKGASDAKVGQLVTVEITNYPAGKGRRNPEGQIVEVLGDPDDPRLDVEVIIREFGLPHEFPAEVLAEAEEIHTEVTDSDIEGREDFRELPVVTIDGENAKDFDDAVYVEKLANGNFKLAVHIADVSAYVPVGSAIDQEARLRATSVYFPDRVVPMLPERLSNEICSLKPGVDRLVQSVVMEINGDGRTVNFELYDGVIRSAERMTYKAVAALLDDSDPELAKKYADHIEHFKRMSELCEVLRGYRSRRGSIDFDLPEPEMRINMVGEVEDILRSERNQAHRLIEEFMIRANEAVASHTAWEEVPSVYRAHEGPDAQKVEQFRDFIGGLGLRLGGGEQPSPGNFQRLVEHLDGQPGGRTLIYLMLRTMKQARYQVDNIGHFGLASPRYTHYTSPIRRYPDLIVHRMVKADLGRTTQQEFDLEAFQGQLHHLCAESSERERNAEGAERRYIDWKTVQFMADKQGDSFEAFITGVHAYGFFVELEELFVEGLVHVSSLGDDYYQYDERKHALRSEKEGRTFALGNRVKVQLVRVDKERRRLDFHLEEGPLETVITPLAEVEASSEADSSGRRRKRRRRGRRPEDKDRAARAADTTDGAEQAAGDARAAVRAEGGDQQDREPSSSRRRRGSRRGRGGRGRRGGRGKSAAADKQIEGKDDGSATSGRRRAAAKSDDEGSSRRRSRSGRSGASGRRGGRGGTGRQSADSAGSAEGGQKRSASSRREAARNKAEAPRDKAEAPRDKVEAPKEGTQPPKVNPYLTDL
jgi:ribonuclease R